MVGCCRPQGPAMLGGPRSPLCGHTGCWSQLGSQAPSSSEFSRSARTPCLLPEREWERESLHNPVSLLHCRLSIPTFGLQCLRRETAPTTVWEVMVEAAGPRAEEDALTACPAQGGALSCLACLEEGVLCTVGLKAAAVSLSPLTPTRAQASALTKEA